MRPITLVLLAATAMWGQQNSARAGSEHGNVLRQPGHPPLVLPGNQYRRNSVVAVPYPVVLGSPYLGYGYGYAPSYYGPDSGYGSDSGYGPSYGYAQPQTPVVVINQNFQPDTVNPVLRDYSNTPLPEPTLRTFQNSSHPYDNQAAGNGLADDQPTIFLIAMKDHTILPSIAYWVMSDTLNYVTVDGRMNRVSMDLVDRDFSKQLNDERHVEFKLPPVK